MKKNHDKDIYVMGLKIAGMSSLIAWLFYDSLWGMLSMFFVFLYLWIEYKNEKKRAVTYQLEREFQTGLVFAAGALEAGYSVENAWREAENEVDRLFGNASVFAPKLHEINQRVRVNESMDRLFLELGKSVDSDNVKNFSEVFFFAKRTGGNMNVIMRRTADRITQNFQILEEIQLQLAAKKMELRVMSIMPFGILLYLRLSSSSFLDPLYHSGQGIGVMTGCLGIYFLAMHMAKKIILIGE